MYFLIFLQFLVVNIDFQCYDYKFVLMVVFMCNKFMMYIILEGWVVDFKQDCFYDEKQILQYCQKVFIIIIYSLLNGDLISILD